MWRASVRPIGLTVAGYQKNDADDLTGNHGNHMRHDAEIEAELRANHRQDEQHADQDHHPIGF